MFVYYVYDVSYSSSSKPNINTGDNIDIKRGLDGISWSELFGDRWVKTPRSYHADSCLIVEVVETPYPRPKHRTVWYSAINTA
jgi:hypothetical protein